MSEQNGTKVIDQVDNTVDDLIEEQLDFIDELKELPILANLYITAMHLELELRGDISDVETSEYEGEMIHKYNQAYVLAVRQKEIRNKEGLALSVETTYIPITRVTGNATTPYQEVYDLFNPDERKKLFGAIQKNWTEQAQLEAIKKRKQKDAEKKLAMSNLENKLDSFSLKQQAIKATRKRKRRTIK